MRLLSKFRLAGLLLCACFIGSIAGCGADSTEPAGPELGSIEAYLNEHPEERNDDDDEAQSEAETFDASDG